MDWSKKQNKVKPQRKYVDERQKPIKKKHKNWDSHFVVGYLAGRHAVLDYSPSTHKLKKNSGGKVAINSPQMT